MTRFRRSFLWAAVYAGAAVTIVTGPALSRTAVKAAIVLPATTYAYEGVVYDRLLIGRPRSRAGRAAMPIRADRRAPSVAGAPYRFTDLSVATGLYGYANAVNNVGDIAYLYQGDYNYNFGDPEVVHDDGTYTPLGEPVDDPYGDAGAVPYALDNRGDVVGVGTTEYYCCTAKNFHADWTPTQTFFGTSFNGSFAYAVNDSNVSVGQALFSGIPAAAVFSISPQGGNRHPVMLLPPKNTSWVGTATGINDAGEIVGYAKERAVLFQLSGYAQVLPVGAAGLSTSAQAINARGDIVGNAGSQAFLYRNHRVTYLPIPPGEAGNAVAFAINASDEIVGDIVDPTTRVTTAFLYVNGQSYDLNSLLPANSGYVINEVTGINDAGEIVGNATSANGSNGFSLKPQSSPTRSSATLTPARLMRF